jgi:hypothetical protein
MTPASRGGLALAEAIAPAYTALPDVRAVIVGGSVARGYADAFSDLELGIFWESPPTDEQRNDAIARLGGELWSFRSYRPDARAPVGEHWGLAKVVVAGTQFDGAVMVDVKHLTVASMETILADVVERLDTAMDKQNLIAAVQDAVVLHGDDLVHRWCATASTFPDDLARKLVQENLWFGPWFCPEAYAGRGDILVVHRHYLWVAQGILRVLAALNRRYYPSSEHKWFGRLIDRLAIAPPDLAERLGGVFRAEPLEGWRGLRAIGDDTLALVRAHMPDLDAKNLFEGHPEVCLAWARARWDAHAPYTLLERIGSSGALHARTRVRAHK